MPVNSGKYGFCKVPAARYGGLTILGLTKIENRIRYYKVRCSCGNVSVMSLQSIERPVKQLWKVCAKCTYVFRKAKVMDCKNEVKPKHNVIDMPFFKRSTP